VLELEPAEPDPFPGHELPVDPVPVPAPELLEPVPPLEPDPILPALTSALAISARITGSIQLVSDELPPATTPMVNGDRSEIPR
jgi:hypothetical protein